MSGGLAIFLKHSLWGGGGGGGGGVGVGGATSTPCFRVIFGFLLLKFRSPLL